MNTEIFNEKQVLHELKHYLPSQQALKDFIHHNSLHAFQHLKFYDAIFKASKVFGYQVSLQLTEFRELYQNGRIREEVLDRVIADKKGPEVVGEWKEKLINKEYETVNEPLIGRLRNKWKQKYGIDLDNQVHPLLFRILCSFLDQGIAIGQFPVPDKSFLESIRDIEQNNIVSFFRTKKIRNLFVSGNYTIERLLNELVGHPDYFRQYLFDQQFAHHGWSGFIAAVEDNPQTLLETKKISLRELVAFELLLELDTLNAKYGDNWKPLAGQKLEPALQLFDDLPRSEFSACIELWQDAFEWSYYDTVLTGILTAKGSDVITATPAFQAIFCIDERECSIRRHLEASNKDCETFGAPGFFGVEFFFQQQGSRFYDKRCPAPVTPRFLIKESAAHNTHQKEPLYSSHTHGFLSGFLLSITYGFWAFIKTIQTLFRPKMSPAISNAFSHMTGSSALTIENKEGETENGLQLGYTLEEMTTRAEGFLRGIGMVKTFSPLVYIVAHGSSSANNPHHGAHDCGACSGRPGAANARVLAFILNHKMVRHRLSVLKIEIPEQTRFIGAMHDTAADTIGYYDDEQLLSLENAKRHTANKQIFETALNLNARERSRRFASINTRQEITRVRKEILNRSVSLFEPRPELGHGTNTLCIIGRREITKGLFLDRRAFLNSYNYQTDPEGTVLTNVMKPIGLVCGGINLEYYFSRVDNIKMGAGTKLPHNVMGLFGVANSSDGDLRPGLPWQMIEVHDPVRLLVIVEHDPAIVLKSITSSPEIFEWYRNEWVHIVAFHPVENCFYYFKNGGFEKYEPVAGKLDTISDMSAFVKNAREMETNHIAHATKENLPVCLLN